MADFDRPRRKKTLVLCFDGTGNKFQGNDGDSNIIKIYSMLDRQDPDLYAYYQPGIGTYVQDSKLSKTGRLGKMRSAYAKVKDQAVGTSFDTHVQGGYRFLMQYYSDGDDLYFFGFSRGAYIARFLAQMLDAVGLLSAGNEEMFRFAWKAFSQWQTRLEETEAQKKQKHETYRFLKAFRETFSRPVSRIRFMGLFDTVNSVPRFEVAWMQRAKFPYAAKSSARVIRHAVSIDERRAKFRQYLISGRTPNEQQHHHHHHLPHPHLDANGYPHLHAEHDAPTTNDEKHRGRPTLNSHQSGSNSRFAPRERRPSRAAPRLPSVRSMNSRAPSQVSLNSNEIIQERTSPTAAKNTNNKSMDHSEQDLKEVWFPGCHADIGGGWNLQPERGETVSLSHAPLVWILREARRAGLPCNDEAIIAAGLLPPEEFDPAFSDAAFFRDAPEQPPAPRIEIDGQDMPPSPKTEAYGFGFGDHDLLDDDYRKRFQDALTAANTKGAMHDSLTFNQGTPFGGVLWWSFMEYLPFRRMDLRPDGTWAPIRWPLPCGETRDIPRDAVVHNSVLKRMAHDPSYRPGNLILSGGGRGVRVAPKSHGMGRWKALREAGDAVGEVFVREDEAAAAEPEPVKAE